MKVVIAPDKFKGSLSAVQAAEAMARGVRRAAPDAQIDTIPMADGGEGTVEALIVATRGTWHAARVTGPLGMPVTARFGITGDGKTALMEMAAASGYVLVPAEKRNPMVTTTRGTGELLLAALEQGVRRMILGIGGSATNDGGAGLAQALGFRLLDESGEELGPGGGPLEQLHRIQTSGRDSRLDGVEVLVACDVANPLCGPEGASAVYGPQKGATSAMVDQLDRNLGRLAKVIERDLGISVANLPGAGAAGGLGAGLVAFAGGRLRRGIEIVMEAVGLERRLEAADLCLTGEGAIDGSTAFGKVVSGVGSSAKRAGCPSIAMAGTLGTGFEVVHELGISAVFGICTHPMTLEQAMSEAADLLAQSAEQATRAFLAGKPGR